MIAIFADTHSHTGHELEGAALEAAQRAEAVVHAGDFTSLPALEAFRDVSSVLFPVHGNADDRTVREALPTVRIVDHDSLRIAVTHRRDGGDVALAMFGRSREADIVVSAHTHRPRLERTDDVLLVNPGSHAQPRGNRPGFGTIESTDNGYRIALQEPDGTPIESARLKLDS